MLDDPTGYGRVCRDGRPRHAIVEQKAATPEQLAVREINIGIYCFRADLFWKHVGEIRPDNPAQGILPDRYGRDPQPRRAHACRRCRSTIRRKSLGINNRVELAEVGPHLPRPQGRTS